MEPTTDNSDDSAASCCADSSGLSPLQYKPLPKSSSIRLLEILPSPSSEIRCSLVTADLDDDGLVFDALSYTWGNAVTIHERPNTTNPIGQLQALKDGIDKEGTPYMFDLDAFTYRCKHPFQPYERVDWHDERNHFIECDGHGLPVTLNLFEALRLLRRWHQGEVPDPSSFQAVSGSPLSRYVWIDMICINQDDVAERGTQVSIMGRIFAQASTVIGWLGPEAGQSRLAVAALRNLFHAFHRRDDPKDPLPASLYYFDGIDEVSTVALFALFQRLWFRRAWIVQEVVLAKRLVLACGGTLMRWKVVEMVLSEIVQRGLFPSLCEFSTAIMSDKPTDKLLRRHEKFGRPVAYFPSRNESWDGQLHVDPAACWDFVKGAAILRRSLGRDTLLTMTHADLAIDSADTPSELRCTTPSYVAHATIMNGPPEPTSFEELLHLFRRCNATDPRDKIFSLLGILVESGSPALDIPRDYTIAVPDLYRMAVESIIGSTNSLNILSQIQDPSETRLEGLPSWVPDFSCTSMPTLIGAPGKKEFGAGGTATELCFRTKKSGAELRVEGRQLDTVQSLASMSGCYFVRTASLVAELPRLYHPGKPATSNTPTRVEAYWRTLLADSYGHARTAPVQCGFDFADWVTGKLIRATFEHRLGKYKPSRAEVAGAVQKFQCWQALLEHEEGDFIPLGGFKWSKPTEGTPDDSEQTGSSNVEGNDDTNYTGKTEASETGANGREPDKSVSNEDSTQLSDSQNHTAAEPHVRQHTPSLPIRGLLATIYTKTSDSDAPSFSSSSSSSSTDPSRPASSTQPSPSDIPIPPIPPIPSIQPLTAPSPSPPTQTHPYLIPRPTRFLPDLAYLQNFITHAQNHNDRLKADRAPPFSTLIHQPDGPSQRAFKKRLGELKKGHRMFRTAGVGDGAGGYLGLGPVSAREGDEVWVLRGARVPFVLRRVDAGGEGESEGEKGKGEGSKGRGRRRYRVVGEAYVHGVMHGEAMEGAGGLEGIVLV